MRRSLIPLFALVLVPACQPPAPATPVPAVDAVTSTGNILARVLQANPDAPRTAAFTQVNTVSLASGDVIQRQRVLVESPGRMRVDNLPLSGQAGAVYVDGRVISFARGRRVAAIDERNPFLLLGFSIFRQPVAATQAALAALGVQTSVIREATFQGSPVWVIGASPGDTVSNQVWIDSERWIPLRLIQSRLSGTRTLVSDTRYSGHAAPEPTVPRTIEIYRDGRLAMRGNIENLQAGVVVPEAAFDTVSLRPVTY